MKNFISKIKRLIFITGTVTMVLFASGIFTLPANADSTCHTWSIAIYGPEYALEQNSSDNQPPVIVLSHPTSGTLVSDPVPLDGSATDNIGITSVKVLVNDSVYGSQALSVPQQSILFNLPVPASALDQTASSNTIKLQVSDGHNITQMRLVLTQVQTGSCLPPQYGTTVYAPNGTVVPIGVIPYVPTSNPNNYGTSGYYPSGNPGQYSTAVYVPNNINTGYNTNVNTSTGYTNYQTYYNYNYNSNTNSNTACTNTDGSVLTTSISGRDLSTSSPFSKNSAAQPGHTIQYQLVIHNNGTSLSQDITAVVSLPAHLTYISGTTTIDGINTTFDTLTSSGLSLSGLSAGSSHILTFKALVDGINNFSAGTTVLTANAQAGEVNSCGQSSDSANFMIYKNGTTGGGVVLGASTVNTGTGGTIALALVSSIIIAGSYLFWASHKKVPFKKPAKNKIKSLFSGFGLLIAHLIER